MMRKPIFREITLLSLPVLLIGAVALWKTWAPPPDDFLSITPPANAEFGPLRLEWGEWKTVAPSAGEAATGHLVKKIGRVWVAGEGRKKWRHHDFYDLSAQDFALEYRRGAKWQKIARNGGWNGIRETRFHQEEIEKKEVQHQKFALAVPFALVPRDADEVRLRGKMNLRASQFNGTAFNYRRIETPQVNFGLWKKGQAWPTPKVNRTPSLAVRKVETRWMGEAAEQWNQDRNQIYNARVSTKVKWNPPMLPRDVSSLQFEMQSVQLLDDAGRDWMKVAPSQRLGIDIRERMKLVDLSSPKQQRGENDFYLDVATRFIPKSAGAIRLKAKVAVWNFRDESRDWPVEIAAIVRPQWMTKTPKNLRLKSVRFTKVRKAVDFLQKGNDVVDIYAMVPCVEAVLEYRGKKPLVVRGEVGKSNFAPGQFERDSIIASIPFGDRLYGIYHNAPLGEAKKGEDELITSWSQRVATPKDTLTAQFHSAQSLKRVRVIGIPSRKSHARSVALPSHARYVLMATRAKALVFTADIGLRGQGFGKLQGRFVNSGRVFLASVRFSPCRGLSIFATLVL
jgi:hypothetical protein